MKSIPAIWRIDIEPDDFQPKSGLPPWTGFVTMADLEQQLRSRLAASIEQGGFFVTDAVVDRAIALGIEVNVTSEPGLRAQRGRDI